MTYGEDRYADPDPRHEEPTEETLGDTPAQTEAPTQPVTYSDELPRHAENDPTDTRVRRAGDVDLDAVSDTGPEATGNRYPQTYESAASEAREQDRKVSQLQAELETEKARRDDLRAKANSLRPSDADDAEE